MSFGLRNAPSTFQRFITEVLYGLDFVFPYLDDVLVASSTEEEHSEHLKMVFERFQQYGLRINVSKSVMELPKSEKKDRRKVHWTDDTRRSFEKCKTDLAEAALLSFPRSGLPLSLCTDASDFAVGAVLQQLENERWKPIAFYSKKLNETQTSQQAYKKSKLGEFEQPDERFSVVHIDLIGKLPPSEGMQYCLTCIDRFSCWMEAIPIPEITAEIVGRAFYEKWICRFGVPAKIVTDQGRQFEAELFRSIAAICGAKVAHTTSYHPQCNGKVERLHRTLKGAIKAHNNIRWTESLPTVLLGLRAAIRPDISYTIAQMVYGTSIKLPGEFFDPPTINMDPQNFVAKLQQHMAELKPLKSPSNRKQNIFVHKDLKSCSHVFLRINRVKKH
ncbi:retrovirus-related Pol polyprotein from transposon opus [Trichonephila clavipes]|uniref:Retrovirus-related Pol polyprotein from transposon opus n=1 Tax=Trichonephila clavipes TaxID=2585209 RepID=A0A8X6T4I4_TRICX|nr:retrovirus-related Pol polyprotein from transposon opus [Trichonephila clavipes]